MKTHRQTHHWPCYIQSVSMPKRKPRTFVNAASSPPQKHLYDPLRNESVRRSTSCMMLNVSTALPLVNFILLSLRWLSCIYPRWEHAFTGLIRRCRLYRWRCTQATLKGGRSVERMLYVMYLHLANNSERAQHRESITAGKVLWRWKAKCYEAALIGPLQPTSTEPHWVCLILPQIWKTYSLLCVAMGF